MRHHRAVLLREPRHVEYRYSETFDVGRHSEDLADRDDAGAPHAREKYRIIACELGNLRHRKVRKIDVADAVLLGLSQRSSIHGHKARTKAVDATEVLVAGTLIDLALAAEFGLERFDRHAVRYFR